MTSRRVKPQVSCAHRSIAAAASGGRRVVGGDRGALRGRLDRGPQRRRPPGPARPGRSPRPRRTAARSTADHSWSASGRGRRRVRVGARVGDDDRVHGDHAAAGARWCRGRVRRTAAPPPGAAGTGAAEQPASAATAAAARDEDERDAGHGCSCEVGRVVGSVSAGRRRGRRRRGGRAAAPRGGGRAGPGPSRSPATAAVTTR